MYKTLPICLAISMLLNSPALIGTAAFAQQQNLMTGAHLPVDPDDDNLPESVKSSGETVEPSVNPQGSGVAEKIHDGTTRGTASSPIANSNAGASETANKTGAAAGAEAAAGGEKHDPGSYLRSVAKSFDLLLANGGHSPVRLLPVAKAPHTMPAAAQPAVVAEQVNTSPQAASATSTPPGAKPPAVPQLSSLRTPVWRATSSAEETVEPEHDGAADTTTAGAPGVAAKDGGAPNAPPDSGNGQKLAMAGSAEAKANVIEYTQVDLIPKLFKRPALILDAQVANGHVTKERLAIIVAATPALTYKSKADKAKEAADKLAMLQGKQQPPDSKLGARQPRKTGSSVLPTPATVTFDLDEVLRALKRENSLIDLKSIGETIMTLRRAVTDHPAEPSLRIKLGSILLLAGDFDGAATEMKHAIALRPKDYRAHLLLAETLDDVADHETAASEFRRAIELAPNAPEPHSLYADSLVYQGDISAAINEYRRAIGVKPNADSLSGLAEALIIAQDKIGSLKAARQAVSLDPSSAKAHVALTKALILNGDQAASMRTARQAVLLSPSLADSHIALGRALHAKGDLDDAVDEFKQAVTLDPLNAQARNDLGYALYSKGDMFAAVSEFRIALRLNPRLGEARNNLEIAIHRLSGRKAP
jgi:Flp pilus assembly protein TadD